jgi:dipeptidyl aminopeptidase/acylaminoacyl peptidase
MLVGLLVTAACRHTTAPVSPSDSSQPPNAPPTAAPAASLAGQQIVFDMQGAGAGLRDIYRIGVNGKGLVQLTADSAEHHEPTMRHGLVAFGSARSTGIVIATVRAGAGASGGTSPVLFGPGDAPALSPDGKMVAYLSLNAQVPRVWTAHVDGTGAQRLAAADAGWDGAIEQHPAWSPVGDRIAYVSTRNGNASIFVARVGGAPGSAALLASAPSGASVEPAWSPDGARVVFTSNRDGPTDLYVVTVAGRVVSRLTHLGNVGQPAWLPGGAIVFTQWTGGTAGLAWLNPTRPSTVHTIVTGGDTQHAAPSP